MWTFYPGGNMEPEMTSLPIDEVQAYIKIKMTRSNNFLIELLKELRQHLTEKQLKEVIIKAGNACLPPVLKVMEETHHLFAKYHEAGGKWPEFMKGESFDIYEEGDKVIVDVHHCPLRPWRVKEPLLCLQEHEYVRTLLEMYKQYKVKEEYLEEETFDTSASKTCRLVYFKANP